MRYFTLIIVACTLTVGTVATAQSSRRSRTGDVAGPSTDVICRRFVRIGTLADFYRVCKTRGEWDRERMNIRNGVMNRNSCQTEGVYGDTNGSYGGQIQCGI